MFQPEMDLATTVYRELEIFHGSVTSANGVDTSETPGTQVESLDEVFQDLRYTNQMYLVFVTPFFFFFPLSLSLSLFLGRSLSRFA